MDKSFEFLDNREITRTFNGIKILQTSRNSFLKDAVEDLYYERSLENGLCIICNIQTSKLCSNCGTHYCSDNCQKIDWPKHRSVCENKLFPNHCSSSISKSLVNDSDVEGFSSFTENKLKHSLKNKSGSTKKEKTTNLIDIKSSGSDFSTRYPKNRTGSQDRSKSTRKSNLKTNDLKLQKQEECSIAKINVSYNQDSENKISGVETCIKNKSTKEESSESKSIIPENEKNNSTIEFSMKNVVDQLKILSTKINQLTIGDNIKVKFTFNELKEEKSSLYWIIKEQNVSKFEDIQKFLSEECEKLPDTVPQENGVYGCIYNGKWCRGKVIATQPNLLIHGIDIGVVYNHGFTNMKILPYEYESWNGLAFPVELLKSDEIGTDEIKCFSDAFVEVIDINSKGLYQIKLFESMNQKNVTDESGKKDIKNETEEKSTVKEIEKAHVVEDTLQKLTHEIRSDKLGSVVDNLKEGYSGVFQLMKYCNEELLGCLVPESIEDAIICHKNMTNLYNTKMQKTEADIGDLVMVLENDNKTQRGRVSSKTKENCYEIFLIDCGYIIKTSEIYKVPENAVNTLELACKMTVLRVNNEAMNSSLSFEVNLSYYFEIKNKINGDKWLCTLKRKSDDNTFADMLLEKTEKPESIVHCHGDNCVPLECGCKVIISAKSDGNMLYIRRIDGPWEEELEEMVININREIENQIPADNLSLKVDDLICAKFHEDKMHYRAKVLSVTGDIVKVLFIDYGNVQDTCVNDLKPLAMKFHNKPIFAHKVTLHNPNCKKISACGQKYIEELIRTSKQLIMNFHNNSSDSVILSENQSFFSINEFVFDNEMEEEKGSVPSEVSTTELKFSHFSIGEKTLIVLHLDEIQFIKDGSFWASDPYHPDFEYIMAELPIKISSYSQSTTSYTPAERELCFAQYEGDWYRGVVTKAKDKEFEIFFIDFGNTCVVQPNLIRKMQPDFFQKAPAIVKCILSGFEGLNVNMRQVAMKFVKKYINECVNSIVEKVYDDSCLIRFPSFEILDKMTE